MAIRFVTAWNGYHADQIISGLGSTEEARLGFEFITREAVAHSVSFSRMRIRVYD